METYELIKESISVAELSTRIKSVEERIKQMKLEFGQKMLASRGMLDRGESYREEQEIIYTFFKELVNEKERYKDVFQTELLSYYFCLSTGESLRFKSEAGDMTIQPIMEKIFYIDNESSECFFAAKRKGGFTNVLNIPLRKVDFAVGAFPMEINMVEKDSKFTYEETENEVVLTGSTKEGAGKVYGTDAYHIGHKIRRICTDEDPNRIF